MVQKFIGFLGIFAFMGIAYLCSSNRGKINYKTVFISLVASFVIAVPVFLLPNSMDILLWFSKSFDKLVTAAKEGQKFVLGSLGDNNEHVGFIFMFQAMPLMIVFSSLFGVLYYFGIMTFIISKIAFITKKILGITAVEAVYSACSLFTGTEAILSIRPFLKKLTRSQMFLIFTMFMSTVASTTLALYVSILSSKFQQLQDI